MRYDPNLLDSTSNILSLSASKFFSSHPKKCLSPFCRRPVLCLSHRQHHCVPEVERSRPLGGTLADHTFLFLGAGEAGTGIADLIALEISEQNGKPIEENRKKIWLVDSKGLIVASRKESLQDFKKPWAHDHEPVTELINTVEAIKPTILIGTSGVVKQFTKEVVEAMASLNKVLYLSQVVPLRSSQFSTDEF
ncbi:NADP-dependent malic enzyme 3-like [Hibiscus syriacus]|uniref:NADP-dependent malic enzyme 3-like n=1 Tax=Hibiscus syriacus TaxID=106335 RepID=UPI0019236881|nr:NADP-dependent malic enzyme 3-like [Hibiscus syriacus]